MKKKLQLIAKAGILFSILTLGFITSPAVTPEYTQMLYPTSYMNNSGVDDPQNALKGAGDVTAVFNATDDGVTYSNFNIPALPSEFTITGIAVSMFGSTTGSKQLKVELTWDGGTNYTSSSSLTAFYEEVGESNLGNSLEKWGRLAWTAEDLSNPNFGIRLVADEGEGDVALMEIAVRVYYVVPVNFCNGSAVFAEGISFVQNSENAVGEPDGNVAVIPYYNRLELDLTGGNGIYRPANTTVKVKWAKTNSEDDDFTVQVKGTKDFFIDYYIGTFTVHSSDLTEQSIPMLMDTRYLIFQYNGASLSVDAVTYNCGSCENCAPTVIVENYCGYSVLKAYDYSGTLTWNTGETTQSISVNEAGTYSVIQTNEGITSEPGLAEAVPLTMPDKPGEISGLATPCEGAEEVYSIDPVNGVTFYQWYVPESWEILEGQGTREITVQTGPTFDIEEDAVSVHVRNETCLNQEGSFLFVQSKSAPAQPGPISGPVNPCEANQVVYSVNSVEGALHYIWAVPESWQILDGNGSAQITVLVGYNIENPQVISVFAGNICDRSEATYLTVESMMCCTQGEPDQYEDNNTMQLAKLITVGNPEISGNILNSKDVDWFGFVTSDAGSYTINYVPGSTLETMALYNSAARKLKPTERNGTTYSLLANTPYYIKISAKLKSPAPCYSLGVELTASSLMAYEQFDDLKSAEIETISEEGIFRIWPNPATEKFTFLNGKDFAVQLRISDFTGRTVEIIQNVGVNQTVTFGENYVTGLYFIEAKGDGKYEVFKIIKQ